MTSVVEHVINGIVSVAWVINGIVFVAWVACIVLWVRQGCPIPKWLHVLAGALLVVGIIAVVIIGITGMLGITGRLSLKLAVLCIIVPPAGMYIGWLWMLGPDPTKDRK